MSKGMLGSEALDGDLLKVPWPPGVATVNAADSSTQPLRSEHNPSISFSFSPNVIEKSICCRISVQTTNTIISNQKGDDPAAQQLRPRGPGPGCSAGDHWALPGCCTGHPSCPGAPHPRVNHTFLSTASGHSVPSFINNDTKWPPWKVD